MNRTAQRVSLLLTGVLVLPSWITPALALGGRAAGANPSHGAALLARGGRGIGSGGGGRRGNSGFQSSGPGLTSGSNRPSGGWSSQSRSSSGPSLERPRAAAPPRGSGSGSRDLNRQTVNRQTVNRQTSVRSDNLSQRSDVRMERIDQRGDVRTTRIENRTDRVEDRSRVRRDRVDSRGRNYWDSHPGWARPGWGYARPWNTGWYGGWSSPSWGWWGPRATAWGVASLTTAAVINAAVNDAVNNQVTYIVIPNSNFELMYGTIAPAGTDVVNFEAFMGETRITMRADCRRGTLNGSTPNTIGEAELMNAACQVAFGSV
jgi:hypothetical protein